MNLEYDFDKIVLLPFEYRALKCIRRKSVHKDRIKCIDALRRAGLADYDSGSLRDSFNAPIPLDTVHITDKGIRLIVWIRRQKMKAVLLPIVISVITTVVLYTLEHWLLPIVLSWF